MYIYHHHQHLINEQLNYSWLKTIVHSLCQQLIKQDFQYYYFYCALRPDSWWWFISYSYYVKFMVEGDSTAFHYIDVNISSLIESGCGVDMIQRSVSLDNKTEDNCIIILLSIHYYLKS